MSPAAAVQRGKGVALFTGERTEPEEAALRRLEEVASLPYVAAPVVGLADLHWKQSLETPSSTATATEGEIVLGFSSPSQNCGMSILRTPIAAAEARDNGFLARLMTALREEIPRSRREPIITRDEAIRFAMGGAVAAAARYGLDPQSVAGIEQRGSLFVPGEADREGILDAFDEEALERGRFSFAYVGGGNHFVEVQAVEEVIDRAAAEASGLEVGGVVLMYHTGSERFGHDLGRLYAVRLKTTMHRRRKYFLRKIPVHFSRSVSGPGDLVRRWRYHFSRRPYIPVPADSVEGRRLIVSLKAAGNYGYANRVAVLDLIARAASRATGRKENGYSVIADLSHNVISRERIGGRDLWIHRHNAVRLRPPSDFPEGSRERRFGQLTMLPGTNRTSSYLLASREGARATLHSADHGAGRTVDRFLEIDACRPRGSGVTLKFVYGSAIPDPLGHLTDEGVDEVVSVLRERDIAAPVVRLRPLAVLKG